MNAPRFHTLRIKRVSPEAAGAVAITFDIPEAERPRFAFEPGQFLTLRATLGGAEVRRSYSISSPRSRLGRQGELEIGIRPVEGGVFSNWAAHELKAGDTLELGAVPARRHHRRQPAARAALPGAAGSSPLGAGRGALPGRLRLPHPARRLGGAAARCLP